MKKLVLSCLIFFGLISKIALSVDYNIENYEVDINVLENNVLKIKETIDADFLKPSHGIVRKIPLRNHIIRQDGTKETNNAKISDIKANEKIKTSFQGDYYFIRLGEENKLIKELHRYIINYNYKLPNDKLKDKDEFYFNIIGGDRDTVIKNAKFRVVMPKPFNSRLVGLSIGKQGEMVTGFQNRANLKILEDENTILAKTTGKLLANEAMTLRVELPEGYFVKDVSNNIKYAVFIVSFILTIFAFLNWFIWGRDERIISVVNFYPPKNVNSGILGVLYRGSSDNKDVVSLIIYLASKGYIKIVNYQNDDFKLEKIKEYSGQNPAEKKLMSALFRKSDVVSKEELQNSKRFYLDCFDVQMMLDKVKEKIFEKKSVSFSAKVVPFLAISGLFTLFIFVVGDYFINFDITFLSAFGALMLTLFSLGIVAINSSIANNKLILALCAMFHVFTIVGTVKYLGINVNNNILALGIIYASIIVCAVCLFQMPRRNKVGIKILGNILGFKKFIESAQKHQIESLIEQDPAYCFDILPFAYVLGVVDKWIKNFENLTDYRPDWYLGEIDSHSFNRFTDSIQHISSPSVDNGGRMSTSSSGGGGFAGGGSGGGGVGRW